MTTDITRLEDSRPAEPRIGDCRCGCDLDALPDGVLVIGADGCVQSLNTRAAGLLGAAAETLAGMDARQAVPLQDLEGRSWWTCADPFGGLPTRTRITETLLVLPGGHEVFLTASLVRHVPRGPVQQVIITLRDAKARRRAEQKTSALISTVAHELRSPLTSVKGFTSTLLRRWDRFSDDQKRLMLETIEADTDRITRLVAELLDVSRIDSGRLELRRQPVDLPRLLDRHVDGLVAAGHPQERFAIRVHGTLPEVWADPDRIEQVMANLVENAVRHGAGTVTVDLQPGVEAGVEPGGEPGGERPELVVAVSDEGDGIPEENYPMVFTRFWHSTRRGGTGLGLYVVRGLVEAHGGRITVGRAPSGGALVRFTLPAGAPEHVV